MPQPTLTAALQNCRRDWDGAIADFDRALQFDPKLAQAYDNRGDAKTETGDFDGAIADFNRALQLNPKYAKAYDNRGLAKLSRGDLDGAMADFNRALQFDPKLAPAYEARGVVKEQKGELDGAIADCNRAIELNPKLAGAYRNRGMAKAYKVTRTMPLPTSTARCSSTRNSPRHMLAMAVRIFWLTTGRQRCRATGVFANCRNEIRHIPACSSGLFVRA